MSSRASGKDGLNYTATLNIEELKKKAEEALKLFKKLQEESQKAIKVNISAPAPNIKPLTAYQEARISATKTLVNAQIASEKLRQENLLLDADLKAGRITAQQAAAATKANTIARQELTRTTKEARQAQVAASGSYDEANKKLTALGRSIKATEGGFKSANPAVRAQIQEYNQLNRALKEFDSSLGNHQRNVGNYGGALNGVIGSLSGMAAGFLSATAILQSAFDTALKTDAIRTSLEFTFNSTEIAQTKMEGLEKTARRLGLEYTSLADSYRAFAGAAVASNFPLKETDKIFNSVANAGAKLKLTSDQVSGALKALEQMISKGNVQSEELKGQLGERLPGAFAIAARAMGVTTMELNKLLKDGKVLASDLLPKLADELDKTFSNDKTEQVKSLQGEVNNLKNSFTQIVETKGALSALFTFVVGAAGKATEGIAKLSQAIGVYYDLLFNGKNFIGDSAKGVRNEALEELKAGAAALAKDIPKDVDSKSGLYNRLNQEKIALRDLTKEYEVAKIAYEKTKVGDRSLADTKAFQALGESQKYQMYLVKSLRQEYENLYGNKGLPKLVEDSALKSVKAIQARINELKKLDGSATEGSDIYKRIEALQARLKKSPTISNDAEVNARNAMQKKIDVLVEKSTIKQLSSDDAEVESVRRKYNEMREEAEKFNNNSKNKKAGLRVDGGKLVKAEETEVQFTYDKQSNGRLKTQLDEQARMFEDNERYKAEYGAKAAEERFTKEYNISAENYQKQYASAEVYLQTLEEAQKKVLDDFGDPIGYTEIQKQQLDILTGQIQTFTGKQKEAQANRYAEALKAAQTYNDKLLAIDKQLEIDKNALRDKGQLTPEKEAVLDRNSIKAASSVAAEELTDSDAWSKLFSNLDELATSQIDALLKEIEGKFSELNVKFDPIDLDTIRKKLNEAKKELIERNPFKAVAEGIKAAFSDGADGAQKSAQQIQTDWNNLSQATAGSFRFVDDAIQSCDILKEAIGEVGTTALSSLSQITQAGIAVSQAVQVAGAASAAVAASTATAIKAAEKASVILAIVSAALSVVQAISGLFKSIFNAHDKRIEKSIKDHQGQVESLGRAYNRLERDVTEAVGKGVEQAHLNQIENLKQQQDELAKIRDAEQSKKKPDQNKINEVNDQIASIADKIKDTQNAMIEALTGTTAKSISDGIISGFKNGKRAAEDFADDFNGLMEDAMLQALKTDFLDKEISNFYKKFAEASKGGLSKDEVENLRNEYTGIIEEGLKLAKDIDKITGGPKSGAISTEALKPNTLTASINQPTAERLEGLWRGNFDLTKQLVVQGQSNGLTMGEMLQIGNAKLAALERIAANTLRGADNTDGIVGKLDQIIVNTKPVKSTRD